jgi:hypothetical protein
MSISIELKSQTEGPFAERAMIAAPRREGRADKSAQMSAASTSLLGGA